VIDLNSEPWSREWLAELAYTARSRVLHADPEKWSDVSHYSLDRAEWFAVADAILAALQQHPVIRAVNAEWEALNKQGARPRTSRGSTGGPGTADKHGGGLV